MPRYFSRRIGSRDSRQIAVFLWMMYLKTLRAPAAQGLTASCFRVSIHWPGISPPAAFSFREKCFGSLQLILDLSLFIWIFNHLKLQLFLIFQKKMIFSGFIQKYLTSWIYYWLKFSRKVFDAFRGGCYLTFKQSRHHWVSHREFSTELDCACCTRNRKRIFVIVDFDKTKVWLGSFAHLPLPVLHLGVSLHFVSGLSRGRHSRRCYTLQDLRWCLM